MFCAFTLLYSIVLAVLAAGGIPACAEGPLELGIQQYKLGRFDRAVIYLSLAEEDQPRNSLVHYYLANALAQTGRHPAAIVEYGISYRLDPHGSTAAFCKQALAGYKEPVPAAGPAAPCTAGGASRIAGCRFLTYPCNTGDLVKKTKAHIREEVVFEKARHQTMGEFFAAGAVGQGEADALHIQEETEREIEAASQPRLTLVGGIPQYVAPDPHILRAKVDELKRRAAERTETRRQLARIMAERYKEWSKARQRSLDEVRANLESLLEEPAAPRGVKLQPLGTDLYTRYYGDARASAVVPEVRPAAARIVDHPTSLRATEGRLPAPGGDNEPLRVEKVVRGSILH